MYNLKTKVENQIKESNGEKEKDEVDMRGVSNGANFHRFNQLYLKKARDYSEPLPEVQEGEEYARNV